MEEKKMEEKIYKSRRLGMPVLILVLALYGAAIFYMASVAISGGNDHSPLFILSILWMCLGWMLFMGTNCSFQRKQCGMSDRVQLVWL